MRTLICSAVTLLALASVCHAACFFQQQVLTDPKNPPKGCQDKDGEMHEFGSQWVKDCLECSCTVDELSCCNLIPSVGEIPPDCEMIADKKTCSARFVLKSDTTKDCVPV